MTRFFELDLWVRVSIEVVGGLWLIAAVWEIAK